MSFDPKKFKIILILALCLAIKFYLAFNTSFPVISDFNMAKGILSGQGFGQSTARGPIVPMFYALTGWLTGGLNIEQTLNIKLAQAILSTLGIFCIYLIGKTIASERVGLIAAAITGLYLPLSYADTLLLSESVTANILIFFALFMVYYFSTERTLFLIIGGFFLGLATLAKPTTLLLVFFLFPCFAYHKGKKGAKRWGLFCLVFLISIMPWVVRNYTIKKTIIPITSTRGTTGIPFWAGHFLPNRGISRGPTDPLFPVQTDASQLIRISFFNIKNNILNQPIEYAELLWRKVHYLWDMPYNNPLSDCLFHPVLGIRLYHTLLIALLIVGCILTANRNRYYLFLHLILLYYTLFHVGVYAISRFAMVVIPLCILIAASVFKFPDHVPPEGRRKFINDTILLFGLTLIALGLPLYQSRIMPTVGWNNENSFLGVTYIFQAFQLFFLLKYTKSYASFRYSRCLSYIKGATIIIAVGYFLSFNYLRDEYFTSPDLYMPSRHISPGPTATGHVDFISSGPWYPEE